ncbi:bifunctional proline dehydrogenase/L-glutamate gamma-semialdehyde dehydrogenase PutA [Sansalvadorimonas verongulae]|uniref:bifunctional proline dehydrogenase/L-glutamate gamma-semialdehyde dehydrogenase PutA n=1 Tax=Sansalvadorimonas verongulae TaxID=2172824 RepID=UPI0012BB4B63|nr:bifunctional proline dehydrogenase/L-glutamate gamma-semialdehyde dehydrogenase PutA [Sansalvadorimonas verongulae]MTI12203.1 bifunctional proline dehydrogenase/L-glutamate gamma-semialdehyde dehydrogenase PutA [Sansalvadorimonas verongulae]
MFKAIDAFTPAFIRQKPEELWGYISPHYCVDEEPWLQELLDQLEEDADQRANIASRTTSLIEQVRASDNAIHMIDSLLLQYSLDTREGILLMCLAEALLRIPDADTADALIRDKLSVADWNKHLSQSESLLVNASTWGLMLTGKVVTMDTQEDGKPSGIISRLVNKMGEPVIRQAVNQAMKIMGKHFVLGRNIKEALSNGRGERKKGYTYSFDMLGEAALTADDAAKYHADYLAAIEAIAAESNIDGSPNPGISIKLSALHPRYEVAQSERVMSELVDSILVLIRAARRVNVAVNMDAEEQDRHELFLKLFEKLYRHPDCQGWGSFGLVVQTYSKRALPTLCWLSALAREQGDVIPVRLVKGAYWDSEIKLCQQNGYPGYPVYTRKEATDVAYLVCTRFLFSEAVRGTLYPQFASHNAHTVASVLTMATNAGDNNYEFQRLHGMGDALYKLVLEQEAKNIRIYAPVGSHKELLPYLVRRLLENGANSSFVHRLVDARTPVESLVHHPADQLVKHEHLANRQIALPAHIFDDEPGGPRRNSCGINIDIESIDHPFQQEVQKSMAQQWHKGPIINGQQVETTESSDITSPHQTDAVVGRMHWSTEAEIDNAIDSATSAFKEWSNTPAEQRAAKLVTLSDLLEEHREELIALCHREAGKTIHDAIDEIREAVDFCRYYAKQAVDKFGEPLVMPGPTGESNELRLSGRGVFLCISPWNFPLAIFLGQVTAALAAGNTVIAKPAEQTSLIAARAIELMLEAGVPGEAIQLLPGDGARIGNRLVSDSRIAGVAFTGSTETARKINLSIANREGAIIPLIAETGGQNAMIVDSTSLPEQVVKDVVKSAFGSAGQRCSALRVLYVQDDIAERVISLLKGAMDELVIGDPSLHATDVGPVIDERARSGLQAHIERMHKEARLLASCELPACASNGHFIAPVAFEIDSISVLEKEHFGPILHVIRYKAEELGQIIEQINSTGYGLTLGVHSRNERTSTFIQEHVNVGNAYINRNQIGAVVGVQPFGGQGLSGTGPKAGGPHYLYRFATEKTLTINTTAVGGNATLLSLGGEH